jgi:hypothetical protein
MDQDNTSSSEYDHINRVIYAVELFAKFCDNAYYDTQNSFSTLTGSIYHGWKNQLVDNLDYFKNREHIRSLANDLYDHPETLDNFILELKGIMNTTENIPDENTDFLEIEYTEKKAGTIQRVLEDKELYERMINEANKGFNVPIEQYSSPNPSGPKYVPAPSTITNIIEIINELAETAGYIDSYYRTAATEQQVLVNVIIVTLKNEINSAKDVTKITSRDIYFKVRNFTFPDEKTPSLQSPDTGSLLFQRPSLYYNGETVENTLKSTKPDGEKNDEYIKGIIDSFFTNGDSLKKYCKEKMTRFERWSPITQKQQEKLEQLQYLLFLRYFYSKIKKENI